MSFLEFETHPLLLKIDMDTPERGILRNAGKNEHIDEEANLAAVKEEGGLQSGDSSGRDGKIKANSYTQATSHTA